MSTTTPRYERIDIDLDSEVVVFTHQRRVSLDTSWKDAEVVRTVEVTLSEIPELLQDGDSTITAKAHGVSTVCQQRSSGQPDTTLRLAEYEATIDNLKAGIWRAAAQPRGAQISTEVVQALANVQGITVLQANAALQQMDSEARKTVRESQAIVTEVARIKAEAALAPISAEEVNAMMAKLTDTPQE